MLQRSSKCKCAIGDVGKEQSVGSSGGGKQASQGTGNEAQVLFSGGWWRPWEAQDRACTTPPRASTGAPEVPQTQFNDLHVHLMTASGRAGMEGHK